MVAGEASSGRLSESISPAPRACALADTIAGLRRVVAAWRAAGESVALVPTMGALHAAHVALIEEGKRRCRRVVVSIFVNPAQFAPGEDFAEYPRDAAGDLAKLAALDVDLVFTPDSSEMYPEGFATTVSVAGVSEGLCAATRPNFFAGVATVVTKLLLQCRPDIAVFGEKDYQQLVMIRRLVDDLDIPVDLVGVATVREADGLAMSSRNAYLSASEREIAARLNTVLAAVTERLAGGEAPARAVAWGRARLGAAGFSAIDYLELRDAETLAPAEALERPARLLAAVRLGPTRLIDNVPVAAG